ncbi:hypothetical protein BWD42_04430 [Sphingobacterium sp. CZ-UAM]|uniref:TetR/AcrR family transcriptional regulator n=1 Tax=Sphingobacterium sp. CZ-UAM TaxID=1933868 RepID=UPI000986EAD8|nr:TetR/AcrR family transcriptional regulator [Sphingobacterium sp. CZ-UAM]OOG19200.1 hypothetical protein BWD42_04430 [Sphingobacterium sp. CZ-UAM]
MNKYDIKNTDLLRRSITDTRSLLLTRKIQQLKVSDLISVLNLSRSTFFRFFGNMNIIFELVISEELEYCYELIGRNLLAALDNPHLIAELNLLRAIYVRKNCILYNYYKSILSLPKRYAPLIQAITAKEQQLYVNILSRQMNYISNDYSRIKLSPLFQNRPFNPS